jgi:hypothetical protein
MSRIPNTVRADADLLDPVFFLIADPDPVPDPGFDDQKLKKFNSLKFFIFFDQKLQKRSLHHSNENIQHFKHEISVLFFYFCGSFLPSWIRIRNLNTGPDPDLLTQINADPDPHPNDACLQH